MAAYPPKCGRTRPSGGASFRPKKRPGHRRSRGRPGLHRLQSHEHRASEHLRRQPRAAARPAGPPGAQLPWRHVRRRVRVAGRQGKPGDDRLPRGGERLHRGDDGGPGGPSQGHLRRDQGADQGNRPVRAEPQGRLVVLRADDRGPAVPGVLPPGRPPGRRRAAGERGRRATGRRGGAAGRQRAGGRRAVLRGRCLQREPRRPAAGLLHRLLRRRALHAAGQGPGDRRDRGRRDTGHVLRRVLVAARHDAVLHHGRRRLAAVPGVAAHSRHRRDRRRPRLRGERREVPGRCRPDPQRALPGPVRGELGDQRGVAARRRAARRRVHDRDAAAAGGGIPRRPPDRRRRDGPAADPAQRPRRELRARGRAAIGPGEPARR